MSIRPLPEDVVGKIRSSSTITSLNGVVCGLLKNSLDAGATKVNIHVEYGRGNCIVEDDGLGIVPGDFAEDGGLGKPYYTSKFPPQHGLYGRQGTFLASLSNLSLLMVTSHHYRHNSHNTISIHHGKLLRRQTPSLPGERFQLFDHGTRVAVNDLFGSLPVRVKHRATLFSDRPGLDKEWGRLVHDVVGLLVSWPSGVTVSLRETKGQRELRLKPPDNADMVSRALRFFTQASLADSGDVDSWVPVSATAGHITIKGCISLNPVATRRSQFMSVGILPVSNEYGSNVLYEEVNKMFASSDFGVIGHKGAPLSPGKGGKRVDAESQDESETNPLTLAERPKRVAEHLSSEKAKRLKVSGSGSRDGEPMGRTEASEKNEPREWLQDILKSWRNPVFESTQAGVPRINDEAPAPVRDTTSIHGSHRCCGDDKGEVRFEAASIGLEGRVSRSALAEAQVVAQVDRKFILLKLPLRNMTDGREPSSSCALVMLDQHAADERCRLEELMAGYFKQDGSHKFPRAVVEPLERPLIFEISDREYDLLQRYQEHLEAWGILYKIQRRAASMKQEQDGYTVAVSALPPSILERCRTEPRLLVELMRKEIWKLDDEGIMPPRPRSAGRTAEQAQPSTADFHGCPRGILELLHSRACRSAIMFNDALSAEECELLVRQLARCAFPFQCAHGRPSLVPLVDLGSGFGIRGWDEDERVGGDARVWKRWMESVVS
ncbi:hypothetical protein TrVGV298_010011 [Trichoderma virens]|nr:hypothetical protein TrVGV298_010011 [Trichoderma virens]